jgi:Family of unknown function (DUF5990)
MPAMARNPPKSQTKAKPRPIPDADLLLRIILVSPPPGVRFCLQRGRDELVSSVDSTGDDIAFDLSVRVKDADAATPRLLGPFTQGPPDARFVYICSGMSAGQAGSCWSRRAKVSLTTITRALIRQSQSRPGSRLQARIPGTAKDGGPSCATVPLLDGGWEVAE